MNNEYKVNVKSNEVAVYSSCIIGMYNAYLFYKLYQK